MKNIRVYIVSCIGVVTTIFFLIQNTTISAQTTTTTFTLNELPLTGPEIINPQRGYYKWRGSEQIPEMRPSFTMYERFDWRVLEPTKDNYNFAPIENEIKKAVSEGRRYAFRIRDLVPQDVIAIPDYLKPYSFTNDGYVVPDYNHPYYLERMEKLLQKVAEKYDGDPRIEYIDIIMYGKWGEVHVSGINYAAAPNGIVAPTKTTLRKIVDIHVDTFRKTQLVMLRGNKVAGDFVTYALNHPRQSMPIGVRNDCLGTMNGHEHFRDISNYSQWPAIEHRWKIAPLVTEFCNREGLEYSPEQVIDYHVSTISNGNFGKTWTAWSATQQAAAIRAGKLAGYRFVLRKATLPSVLPATGNFTLSSVWSNVGVAPAYQDWVAEVQLRQAGSTAPVWKQTLRNVKFRCSSNTDTQCLLPTKNYTTNIDTPRNLSDTLSLNGQVPAGSYDVVVKIITNDPYWKTVKLANSGKTSDDAYLLGKVTVGTGIGATATPTPTSSPTPKPTSTTQPSATPVSSTAPLSRPYKQVTIPGIIQAEDYDLGGQEVGYFDTTLGNMYKFYREDDVDVKERTDGDQPIHIGGFTPSEWLRYSFIIPKTGRYTITAHYATLIEGSSLLTDFGPNPAPSTTTAMPTTGAWSTYQDQVLADTQLNAGNYTMTITNTGSGIVDLDYLSIEMDDSLPTACDANLNPVTSDNPNGDKIVDLMDYSILVNNFLADPIIDARADINKDGTVDLTDYSILINFFTETCTL